MGIIVSKQISAHSLAVHRGDVGGEDHLFDSGRVIGHDDLLGGKVGALVEHGVKFLEEDRGHVLREKAFSTGCDADQQGDVPDFCIGGDGQQEGLLHQVRVAVETMDKGG